MGARAAQPRHCRRLRHRSNRSVAGRPGTIICWRFRRKPGFRCISRMASPPSARARVKPARRWPMRSFRASASSGSGGLSAGFRLRGSANALPEDWWQMLPAEAGLFTVDHWQQVLAARREAAATARRCLSLSILLPAAPRLRLMPVPFFLPGKPASCGRRLCASRLPRRSTSRSATSACPTRATRRTASSGARPRISPQARVRYVRMLGLTSGAWPRAESEDPILPDHILPRRARWKPCRSLSATGRCSRSSGERARVLCLSRGRRSAPAPCKQRARSGRTTGERTFDAHAHPLHAFSEADRLLARPKEAMAAPLVAASRQCWEHWRARTRTAHDGATGAHSDVAVGRALARAQSTTSIRRLLRDPAGFVWRYALGWQVARVRGAAAGAAAPGFRRAGA